MMRAVIISVLTASVLLPAMASAQYYPRARRARPVVVLPPPPPPVVMVPQPVYVPVAPVAVVPAVQEEETFMAPLTIGVRFSGVGVEGRRLHLSDLENPAMGGIGLQLRSRFDDHWGFELATDFIGGVKDDFRQLQIPITLSLMFHLFPESRIQPYFLVGGGIQFTEVSYLDGAFKHNITEGVGQLGAGVDIWLTRRLALNADVRALGYFSNLGSRTEVSGPCLASSAAGTGLCAGLNDLENGRRFNAGIQFLAGISYAF